MGVSIDLRWIQCIGVVGNWGKLPFWRGESWFWPFGSKSRTVLAPLWRCRPLDLRLTTRSPKLITVICRLSSIKATDMPCEVLGVRLRQQRQYQLLSIRNGPSKASSNAPRSGMIRRTILSSNCHRFRNTFTYRLVPKHWTSITTLLHIPKYIKHRWSERRARFHGQEKRI
jgi:hypothetical protein